MTNPYSGDYAGDAYASDQFLVSNTAVGVDDFGQPLTDPDSGGKCCAVIVSTSAAIRYTIDGSTPTASVGMPIGAGTTFLVTGYDNVDSLRLIRQVGDSTVDVTFLRS